MIEFNKDGNVEKGTPVAVVGAALAVDTGGTDSGGLKKQIRRLVWAHEAVDQAAWMEAYNRLGGELLFDEDGDPV